MNIKFNRINIQNFLSIGEAEVELNDLGFVLVKGKNNEVSAQGSNGSGKSAIFDAIFWTLTGETMRGTSEVVNENRGDGAVCELEFTIDDTNYKILRSKSHSEYGNAVHFYQNDELLSNMTKKSQEMINDKIPTSDPQILGSIIILGQGLPYKFTNLSPIKRKDLLETMSGSGSQIDGLKFKLEQKEGELTLEVNAKRAEIAKIEGKTLGLERLKSELITQRDSKVSKDEVLKQTEELGASNRGLESDYENIVDSIKDKEVSIKKYTEAFDQVKSFASQKEYELSSLRKELSSFKSGTCPTCGRPYEVTAEMLSKKSETEKKISDTSALIATLEAKSSSLRVTIDNMSVELKNSNEQLTSIKWEINDNLRKIEELSNSLKVSNDLDEKIVNTENEIKAETISQNKLEDEIKEISKVMDCVSYLKRLVSRDFKGYILQDAIDFMSKRSEYYGDLMFSKEKKLVVELSGNKILVKLNDRLYENLSGGEKQRADLAVQFALRDMLVVTSGFSCNILVLDEAFDNLDSLGSEYLVNLISNEFSDIESVFVITHHQDIAIPYDKCIKAVKDHSGVTSIVEE